MPISRERMKLYPGGSIRSPEWLEIRTRILVRAGGRCEGTPHYPDCRARNGEPHPVTRSRVVLTIMHLNHDPRDNRDDNLKAGCQRCHLTYDAAFHAENAGRTRRSKQPQGDLVDLIGVSDV